MIRQIVNPETGRKVSIDSQKGHQLVKELIKQIGGKPSDRDTCHPKYPPLTRKKLKSLPAVGDKFTVRSIVTEPNYDKKRPSLLKKVILHHYIEIKSKDCLYTYGLLMGPGGATVINSPDYITDKCRTQTEACLEKVGNGEEYVKTSSKNASKSINVPAGDLDGCNFVCIGIDTIVDKDDKHGNNNLPRGIIVLEGTLDEVQVEIIKYIHMNSSLSSTNINDKKMISLNLPFKYSLVCAIPGLRVAQEMATKFLRWMQKNEQELEHFANCQSFARDFSLTPVNLYNTLYGDNADPKMNNKVTKLEQAIMATGKLI
jgi:hypothetical protein